MINEWWWNCSSVCICESNVTRVWDLENESQKDLNPWPPKHRLWLMCKPASWSRELRAYFWEPLGYLHIWSTPRVINAILGHYAHFWIFWRESFEARKQARGLRLGLAGSQNSLPPNTWRAFYPLSYENSWKARSFNTYLVLVAQWIEHPPGVQEVMGSNPIRTLIFF